MYQQVGGNGRIVDGTIWGSKDGENWEVLTSKKGITYPKQANTVEEAKQMTQDFKIDDPKEVQYVKIVADKTNGNWFAARAFNFYQDITKKSNLEVPTARISYNTTEKTRDAVIARLVNPSTKITITNNDGKDTYVFTENGSFTFEFKDENGNKGNATATVTWIDKDGPTADVQYRLGDDKKLIAILDNISEDVYLLNENNKKTNYIEVENGKVVSITYLDESENEYKIAELDENKVTKKITYKNTTGVASDKVKYYVTIPNGINEKGEEIFEEQYFDEHNAPVTDLTEEEKLGLRVLQQTTRSNPLEYYLEKNKEYQFKLLDKASNITYKNVKVDYIEGDTKVLASDITYSTTMPINKDVTATIKTYVISEKGKECAKVINNNGSETYTFTKNGEFTFEYADCAEDEINPNIEIKTHTAKVNWIDKDVPTAKIKYSSKEATNKVIVTLENESEPITIINNGGLREYIFTQNGEFTFQFQDKAGNKGTAIAKVDWIKKDQENQEKPNRYLIGDINKDGKITATDLLLVKRHLVAGQKQEWILTGDKFNAGDINKDGKITATDLILIKRLVLKQMEIQS